MRYLRLVLVVAFLTPVAALAQHEHAAAPGMTDEQLIASAMKAAPAAIGEHAAVIALSADGSIRTVREGTNGFSCLPDHPGTPGPDPMCADANAMAWASAWLKHEEPPAGKVGFMYMLAGGSDASNTDPFATAPMAGNHWVATGPHVMIVGAKGMLADYPRSADPDVTNPYVMWPDTPYEHLMIPVH